MSLNYLAHFASLQINDLFEDGYPKILVMNENEKVDNYLKKSLIGLIFQGHRIVHDNLYLNFNKFIPYLEYLMTNWAIYQKFIFKNNEHMDIFSFFKDIEKYFSNVQFTRREDTKNLFLFTKTEKTNISFDDIILEVHYPQEVNDRTLYLWFEYLRALVVLHQNKILSKKGYVLLEPRMYGNQALRAINLASDYSDMKKNYENFFGKKIFENLTEEPNLFFNFYH